MTPRDGAFPPPAQFAPPPKPSRSSSGGATCLLVGLGLLSVIVLVGIVVGWALAATSSISRSFANLEREKTQLSQKLEHISRPEKVIKRFTDRGFTVVEDHIHNQSTTIKQKTLFSCQILQLKADSEADVAILSQTAKLNGNIEGNVDFFGQLLVVEKDAVIHGDLNVGFGQMVTINGTVKGQLLGDFRKLQGKKNVEGGVVSAKNGQTSEPTGDSQSPTNK
jgi:hypothetical protein